MPFTPQFVVSLFAWALWRYYAHEWAAIVDGLFLATLYFLLCQTALWTWTIHAGPSIESFFRWSRSKMLAVLLVTLSALSIVGLIDFGFEFDLILRVCVALMIGGIIGRRVSDSSYLWPLVMVASVADIGSLTLESGFTYQVAEDAVHKPHFLHPLLVYAPGPNGIPMPLVGLADIVFLSLLQQAAQTLKLPKRHVNFGGWLGVIVGIGCVTYFEMAMPLLPFLGVGVCVVLGTRIRPKPVDLLQSIGFIIFMLGVWLFLK